SGIQRAGVCRRRGHRGAGQRVLSGQGQGRRGDAQPRTERRLFRRHDQPAERILARHSPLLPPARARTDAAGGTKDRKGRAPGRAEEDPAETVRGDVASYVSTKLAPRIFPALAVVRTRSVPGQAPRSSSSAEYLIVHHHVLEFHLLVRNVRKNSEVGETSEQASGCVSIETRIGNYCTLPPGAAASFSRTFP